MRDFVVDWNSQPIKSVKTGFNSVAAQAGLDGRVTTHTLRHSAATWLMQAGVDKWKAAGYLSMSVEMLDRVYGHHHPNHLQQAARSIGYRTPKEALVAPLVEARKLPKVPAQVIERLVGPAELEPATRPL